MRSTHWLVLLGMTCAPVFAGAQTIASDEAAAQLERARSNVAAAASADVAYAPVPTATEKSSWIGVGVSPAPEVIRRQLGLPEGTGLVVDIVMPKSPASEGDVKPYDVLVKLDDQVLINPEQFAVLVRIHKPGEKVKLTFAREGKEQTASVQLVEHEAPKIEGMGNWLGQMDPPIMRWEPQRSMTWIDGKDQITIATLDGHRFLRMSDADGGRKIFSGPIDTAQQRQALPSEARDMLKHLKIDLSKEIGSTGPKPSGESSTGGTLEKLEESDPK